MPIGTLINALAILLGGSIGVILNTKLPEKVKTIVFQAIGLFTIVIGLQIALKTTNPLIMVFSLLIGGIIGELAQLEIRVESISDWFQKRLKIKGGKFTEGVITSFLLFCVGSMTIIGSINEGVSGDRTLLLTKSILDGFSSIALASSFGVGVIFSVFPLLAFQGGLTVLASYFGRFISPIFIDHLTTVGGVLILAIGINLLELKKIKVINLLPSLLVVILLVWLNMMI